MHVWVHVRKEHVSKDAKHHLAHISHVHLLVCRKHAREVAKGEGKGKGVEKRGRGRGKGEGKGARQGQTERESGGI